MDYKAKIFTNELNVEIKFNFSRSSGPGGQHVNKVNTKAELRLDIKNSNVFNEEEKALLLEKLFNQINQEGVLIIVSQASKSQLKNKEEAITKLYTLINKALKPKKKRKATSVPQVAKEKRLKDKKETSEKKDRRKSFL